MENKQVSLSLAPFHVGHSTNLLRQVWRRWINKEDKPAITLMFGVPTVYSMFVDSRDVQCLISVCTSSLVIRLRFPL